MKIKNAVTIAGAFFCLLTACNSPEKDPVEEVKPITEEPKPLPPDSTAYFDSILKLKVNMPPIWQKGEYDKQAIADFSELANKSGGKFTYVRHAKEVAGTATNIIRKSLSKGADVLFLVDKTGSMADDIENIKNGLHQIVKELGRQKDVRCGMAFYGDKNEDRNWFNAVDFTYKLDSIKSRISDIKADGGGDLPESVYDGFFQAMTTMNFDTTRKVIVLVIGDAPSLDSNLADHSLEDVIAACKQRDIAINLYPMLLATNDGADALIYKPKETNLISKIFPNPSRGTAEVVISQKANYEFELINQRGGVVKRGKFQGDGVHLDLSSYSNGLYVFRIINAESRITSSSKIILQR
jgi:hypothetical protein